MQQIDPGARTAEGRRDAGVGRDENEGRVGGRGEGDFASTTIRKSSLGYAAMRAEGKRERRISLAGAFAPLRLNALANELLAKTLVRGREDRTVDHDRKNLLFYKLMNLSLSLIIYV